VNKKRRPVVNLHGHGEHSPDGSDTARRRVRFAKALEQPALALTDHGVPSGLIEHYNACIECGVKPVLGIEFYYMPKVVRQYTKEDLKEHHYSPAEIAQNEYESRYYHATVLVKNMQPGYENLMYLVSESNKEENFYRHPIVTDEMLEKFSGGLILFTGCLRGWVPQHILAGESQAAYTKLKHWVELFDHHVWGEVMPHDFQGQAEVNRQLEVWSDLYGLKLVVTPDSHYIQRWDYPHYKTLRAIKRWPVDDALSYERLFMPSDAELEDEWTETMGDAGRIHEYMDNTIAIAESTHVEFSPRVAMPQLEGVSDPYEILCDATIAGLEGKGFTTTNKKHEVVILPAYRKRAAYELETYRDKNFVNYLLMNVDLATEARRQSIAMRCRGSACGSLVAYVTGMHKTDPLRYHLSFERFCGPERPEWDVLDIDHDVGDEVSRDKLFTYLGMRYPGRVAKVAAFNTFGVKSALNAILKEHSEKGSLSFIADTERESFRGAMLAYVSKSEEPEFNWKKIVKGSGILRYMEDQYSLVSDLCYCLGQVASISQHAAGVAITAGPLEEKLALMKIGTGNDAHWLACYDMDSLKAIGVLKIDLLIVDSLAQVDACEKMVNMQFVDHPMTEGYLNAEDGVTYYDVNDLEGRQLRKAMEQGDLWGIFQYERAKSVLMCKQYQPDSIEEAALVTAFNRPGAIAGEAFEMYLQERQQPGSQAVLPFVYQEQVMEFCHSIGMTWEQVAQVMHLAKKKLGNDETLQKIFIDGTVTTLGVSKATALKLWHSALLYGFSKNHAVPYALLAAQQILLREQHPVEFFVTLLGHEKNEGKRSAYETDGYQKHGQNFLIPHVNGSAEYQIVDVPGSALLESGRYIQQGLKVLPGLDNRAYEIEAERLAHGPYVSAEDVKKRLSGRTATSAVVGTLTRFAAMEFDKQEWQKRCFIWMEVLKMKPHTLFQKEMWVQHSDEMYRNYREDSKYLNGNGQ